MGIFSDTEEEKRAKREQTLKDKLCDKPKPCEKERKAAQDELIKQYQSEKVDGETYAKRTIKNEKDYDRCEKLHCQMIADTMTKK